MNEFTWGIVYIGVNKHQHLFKIEKIAWFICTFLVECTVLYAQINSRQYNLSERHETGSQQVLVVDAWENWK